tara:strand:+ start:710 stop:1114 length:405 start_codon:yes stop_codon:yes gene_type:complete
MITNIKDLAEHLGLCFVKHGSTTEAIGRKVYEATECGCPAGVEDDYFWVTGHCEGSARPCEVYTVSFPCEFKTIEAAIKQADADGNEVWDQTHGCSKCWPEGTTNKWGESIPPNELGGPINPDCETCGGNGVIF